ncbi:MAG: hypothetical protein NT007_19145 [Candidatus Kapabacteria bacterium]|nr:hypothetical protein [Candidatus Kapabacteria bacterium]
MKTVIPCLSCERDCVKTLYCCHSCEFRNLLIAIDGDSCIRACVKTIFFCHFGA